MDDSEKIEDCVFLIVSSGSAQRMAELAISMLAEYNYYEDEDFMEVYKMLKQKVIKYAGLPDEYHGEILDTAILEVIS